MRFAIIMFGSLSFYFLSFVEQEFFLILIEYIYIYIYIFFLFLEGALVSCLRTLSNPVSEIFSPIFSSKCLIDLRYIFDC